MATSRKRKHPAVPLPSHPEGHPFPVDVVPGVPVPPVDVVPGGFAVSPDPPDVDVVTVAVVVDGGSPPPPLHTTCIVVHGILICQRLTCCGGILGSVRGGMRQIRHLDHVFKRWREDHW